MQNTLHQYRAALPQLQRPFIADGGLETTLIYLDGYELPSFAAFTLLDRPGGRDHLRRYYERYVDMAARYGYGVVLDAPTWRAQNEWGPALGYDDAGITAANQRSMALLQQIRQQRQTDALPIVLSGALGPRGDGYAVDKRMTAESARTYHAHQIRAFADSPADMVSAYTLNYIDEAIGVALAARDAAIPVVISFTVETDGRLPSGEHLRDAITAVDQATGAYPVYFMLNCAHPTHFDQTLRELGDQLQRLRGLRANASCKSHAELDEATELDIGDPVALGQQYRDLSNRLAPLAVIGGCCGTDHRHLEAICSALQH